MLSCAAVAALPAPGARPAPGALQSCLPLPAPRGACAWEGCSSELLALALGRGKDTRTLAWALVFKTPPGIACSLEQAGQKAGGSILGSSGAVRIQFHIYFLSLQSIK